MTSSDPTPNNWDVNSQHNMHQGHVRRRQFHFAVADIYHNPSLQHCSSSITPKPSMVYSGFEDSPGKADRLCEISWDRPYKILPSDETLSLLWITVSSCICDVTSVDRLSMSHRLESTCRLGLLCYMWQQWYTSNWSVLPIKKTLILASKAYLSLQHLPIFYDQK